MLCLLFIQPNYRGEFLCVSDPCSLRCSIVMELLWLWRIPVGCKGVFALILRVLGNLFFNAFILFKNSNFTLYTQSFWQYTLKHKIRIILQFYRYISSLVSYPKFSCIIRAYLSPNYNLYFLINIFTWDFLIYNSYFWIHPCLSRLFNLFI